jgi:hypothetical protein
MLIEGIHVKLVNLQSKIPTAIALDGDIFKWTEKMRFIRNDIYGMPVYPKAGFDNAVVFNGMMYCTAKSRSNMIGSFMKEMLLTFN